jgi:replicative DNA helicase
VIMEEKLGSIPQGCTVAVLASTNVGKSSLVLEMLVRAAQRNVTCGYLSVEDQEPVVRSRLVGMLSGVSSRAILERKLNASDFDRIGKAYEELKKLRERLHVSILQGGTDVDVCSSLSELAAKGCKLVAVDYIQKVTASRTYQNKAHEVSASATRITSHAQRLGLACVVVSQCGRDKTRLNECPSKHDMKESGDLENMVDAIIGLWREHESDVAPIKARLLKVKWGGVGDQWELKRNTRTGRLEEVT